MTKKELLYFFGTLALLSTLNTEDSLKSTLKKDPGYKAEKPCNAKKQDVRGTIKSYNFKLRRDD